MTETAIPLVVRRVIPARRELVFGLFADADALPLWFTPSPEVRLDVLLLEFVEGGAFRFRYTLPDGRRPVVGGIYQRIDRPGEIVQAWTWEPPDPLGGIPMRVRFRLHDRDNGTEVVVTHEGIPSDTVCTVHEDAWSGTLGALERAVAAIEHKETGPCAASQSSPS